MTGDPERTGISCWSTATDVMLEILGPNGEIVKIYKYPFSKEEKKANNERNARKVARQYWLDLLGENSPHQHDGKITIVAKIATAVQEMNESVGAVASNESVIECTAMSEEEINAWFFGLYDEEFPVSAETRERFLQAYVVATRTGQKFEYSFEEGCSYHMLFKVSGAGLKVQSPIFHHLFTQSIDGVPKSDEVNMRKRYKRLTDITNGSPRELVYLMNVIADYVLIERFTELGIEYSGTYYAKNMEESVLDLNSYSVIPEGKWFDLSHRSEKVTVEERIAKQIEILSFWWSYLTYDFDAVEDKVNEKVLAYLEKNEEINSQVVS
jgi:hypothetical protein